MKLTFHLVENEDGTYSIVEEWNTIGRGSFHSVEAAIAREKQLRPTAALRGILYRDRPGVESYERFLRERNLT